MQLRAHVITVSDGCYRGERTDSSGPLAAQLLEAAGHRVIGAVIVPDEELLIAAALLDRCTDDSDLILTTGGTGFAPRDVTPEASRRVIEREAPGLAEALRWTSYPQIPRALLSRGVAGIRGNTVIINLPGSTGAVRDGLAVLLPLLPHAVALLRDEPVDHTPGNGSSTQQETLAVHAGSTDDAPPSRVVVIETNIDDLSPEMMEPLMDRLFAAGAVDCFITPIQMKRNRPAVQLTVLSPPEKLQTLASAIFDESSSFGLRFLTMDRITLDRSWVTVETEYGAIRVKVGRHHGVEKSASPEYRDVRAAAERCGAPARVVYEAALVAYRLANRRPHN